MARGGLWEVYRIHAANCIRLAQKAADADGKLALLDMARA